MRKAISAFTHSIQQSKKNNYMEGYSALHRCGWRKNSVGGKPLGVVVLYTGQGLSAMAGMGV
jgi:hypothetical protein